MAPKVISLTGKSYKNSKSCYEKDKSKQSQSWLEAVFVNLERRIGILEQKIKLKLVHQNFENKFAVMHPTYL